MMLEFYSSKSKGDTTNLDTDHGEFKWSIIVLFATISFFVVIPTSDKRAIGAARGFPPHRSAILGMLRTMI